MIEKLKKKIELKQNEIIDLKNQLEKEENKQYEYLIGKIIRLAATCCIKIKEIDYIDDSYIHVYGTKIMGGKGYSDEFRIELNGSESLRRDCKPFEIDENEYYNFMNENFDFYKEKIKLIINE